MMKLLKNKNVILVLCLLAVSIAVLIFAGVLNTDPETLPNELTTETTASAVLPEDAGMPLGYILAQRNGDGGWIPLPTSDSMTITDEEDENIKNVIRLTPNGFYMESSTCDNQDCVEQGEVTLENMDERVLMNMVICLPHQLSVELYSIEQLVEMSTAN